MRYVVTSQRSVGDQQERVVRKGMRRLQAALNERDLMVESATDVARRHAAREGLRVCVGGVEGDEHAVAVVTMRDNGDLWETITVRQA